MPNIIPNQRGKLPSEPDLDRLIGVELEYHPGSMTMWEWRAALYDAGIDTMNDGCNTRQPTARDGADACGLELPNPDRLRTRRSCQCVSNAVVRSGRGGITPRTVHVEALLRNNADHQQAILDELFRSLGLSRTEYTSGSALSEAARTALGTRFPAIDDTVFGMWNLGTDPTAGLELRSPPATIKEGLLSAVEIVAHTLQRNGADATPSCGTHVHIDMRDKDRDARLRLLIAYRMLEPVVVAAVEPHRYVNGYNRPLWSNASLDVSRIGELGSTLASASDHGSLLNFSALNEHGTVEFRQLEGSLDPVVLNNWIILATRMVQASANKSKWGVRLRSAEPIAVSKESVHAYMGYLDLIRKGIDPRLKDARDWYIERVRKYTEERPAFRRGLTTTNTRLNDFKLLKKEGIASALGRAVVTDVAPAGAAVPSEQYGRAFLRVIQNMIAVGAPVTLDRHSGAARTQTMLPTDYLANDNMVTTYAPSYFQAYPNAASTWAGFAQAVIDSDLNAIGEWLRTHIYTNDTSQTQRVRALANLLYAWSQQWDIYGAQSSTSVNAIINTHSGENTGCVDF